MRLLIYCAGGLGKTLLDVARAINAVSPRWKDIAFIDDVTEETESLGARVYKYSDILKISEKEEIECIIATGEPVSRKALYDKLKADHIPLTNIIAPSAHLSDDITLGHGIIIFPDSVITSAVDIKDNVFIGKHAYLGGDVSVGEHSVLSARPYAGEHVSVGKQVFVGAGALLNEGITIKDDALISIGSVVFQDVGENKIIMGNPGKEIGNKESRHVFHFLSDGNEKE